MEDSFKKLPEYSDLVDWMIVQWKNMLNIDSVDINESILFQGATSMSIAIFGTIPYETYGVNVPLDKVIENRSIEKLANYIIDNY